jgi:N6-L-threonylcarbamoyladenine synthase
MKILAIETSCDETAAALLDASGDLDHPQFEVLAKKVHSQIEDHKEYGGVYPSLAKREHAKNIIPVTAEVLGLEKTEVNIDSNKLKEVEEILEREPELFQAFKDFVSTVSKPEIDTIAVTNGPGLEPALWVGINFAKALSLIWNIPVMPTNHMEGHMASVLLNSGTVQFPAVALLISGGHTELVEINNWNEYKILGKTKDDAVGESYDKVARLLGIPYPGGPEISKLAQVYRNAGIQNDIKFPRPMINSNDCDFSFSGLKTAVLYKIQELSADGRQLTAQKKEIIAGEFEQAVVDVLINKTNKVFESGKYKSLIVAGGVVANEYIRENLSNVANQNDVQIHFPNFEDSTDNAQMIAVAGYLKSFKTKPSKSIEFSANGSLTYNIEK